MARILIVDDDPRLRKSFEKLLLDEEHTVLTAATGEASCSMLQEAAPDLVVMDVRLPGMSGLEAFRRMHRRDPRLPVIVMTAFGTTDTAIEATKLGAFDYILKPFDIPDMLARIGRALEAGRFMRNPVGIDAPPEAAGAEALVGKSPVMQEVYKAIGRVAPTDTTILLRGESGTGKELAARALYQHSLRAEGPFLVINCVAIPETLLEAELFGYEKGSFTGATSRRIGKVEQAHTGTLFLDEIGDMPLNIQAKILRLLQEKTIERLGASEPIHVDVRIIAATNRDLEGSLKKGLFREDLYYRLNVVAVEMPPLRSHPEDVPLLCSYFLAKHAADLGAPNPGITDEAVELLGAHAWQGNVRELANTMQKALIFNSGCPISADDISGLIHAQPTARDDAGFEEAIRQWTCRLLKTGKDAAVFSYMTDRCSEIIIKQVLELTRGNQTQAAKILGLSRPTLQSKMEKYGLKKS